MGLKDQLRQNAAASQQATCTPSGCKACQRQGLPIFPLRVAAVPKALVNSGWQPAVPQQDIELTGGEFKYALRTLRMGYLYVLLDKTIWQGYQVTAEGYLRQFNPLAMPEGETVEPLSTACLTHGHDIAASFINIDDTKYQVAWLAFSSDPWSETVLAEYKSGQRPASRFTKIMLSELKNSPANVPEALALNPSLSALKSHVAEFATKLFSNTEKVAGEPLGGAHGFYPRLNSEMALGLRIAQLGAQYRCQIAALALDDTVGVVQELNNSRMQIVEARQVYNEIEEVRHKNLISIAIEQSLAAMEKAITDNSKPRYERPTSGYPAGQVTVIPKEQVAQETYATQLARLQKCYKEPERATFAKQHQRRLEDYQQRIEAVGKDLAAGYRSQLWLSVIKNDYAPETSVLGWVAQFTTLTVCIQGGSTDAATESLWHEWLKNKEGLVYTGLLGNRQSVLEAAYDGIGDYTNLKAVMGADEVGNWLGSERLRRTLVQRTLAISGAVSRLASQLEQSALDGYNRVVQGVIYMTSGHQVTLFTLNITLGDFQKLYQDIARTQLSATGKSGLFDGLVNKGTQATRTVATGSLLQITDPEILERRITATLVSDMPPEQFKAAVRQSGSRASALEQAPLKDIRHVNNFSELRITSVTLAESTGNNVIMLNPAQTQQILRSQAQMIRRVVGGNTVGVGLSAGMMYLQITALEANSKALDETIGNDTKARLVLLTNMTMVVSSMVESAGFVRTLAMDKPWTQAKAHWLIRAGGVIAGIASIIDGVGMILKGVDASQAGDKNAKWFYYAAGVTTFAGGVIGIGAAWAGAFTLFGPAGLAALLILAGAALVIHAEKAISTAFEIWLRRCCFGDHQTNVPAWFANSPRDLNEALAAYNAIVNGLTAEVGYQDKLSEILNGQDLIKLRIVLPCCDENMAAWGYSLSVPVSESSSQSYPLLAATHNTPTSTSARLEPLPDSLSLSLPPVWRPGTGTVSQYWQNGDLIIEGEAWVDSRHYNKVKLEVNYWPDKLQQDWVMGLQIQAKD
ncbi:T6SS effector BTH_I2691 family protein [Yersinia pseudotuberculosis]|uniref:T6SS effector BTH_I2691 family protein n=1 Tax=Yersinia pseudotuberculosis TaxID=633 RepID=UPI002B2BEA4F|nr:hypothetical protein YPSE1_26510 [Yersinia pseudotuberculosis]